jgi:hypothetical protein
LSGRVIVGTIVERWQHGKEIVVVVNADAELAEIIQALGAVGGLTHLLGAMRSPMIAIERAFAE